MSHVALSDLNKMTTPEIIAVLSHLIYERAIFYEFPDDDLNSLKRLVDELEHRLVIAPELATESGQFPDNHSRNHNAK